jgi:hypothetical protein
MDSVVGVRARCRPDSLARLGSRETFGCFQDIREAQCKQSNTRPTYDFQHRCL